MDNFDVSEEVQCTEGILKIMKKERVIPWQRVSLHTCSWIF